MTTRTAELCMAVLMGVFSVYLMWKSAELPIGWLPGEGPGGGAWPFWLAAIMLFSCLGILYNWVRRKSAVAVSKRPYIERGALIAVGLVAGALIVTVGLFSFIGVYAALPLFLIFYLRFLGNHSWKLTLTASVVMPVVTFFFFEITLHIILPKGITEPLFYPLFKIFL